jgi:hypothetical protein
MSRGMGSNMQMGQKSWKASVISSLRLTTSTGDGRTFSCEQRVSALAPRQLALVE